MIVEEGVSGIGVLFHVVLDAEGRQRLFEALRRATQGDVLRAVTGDNRAGASEDTLDLFRQDAIVDARCRKPVTGRQQQGKSAAHAKADHPDVAGTIVALRQLVARGCNMAEHHSLPCQVIVDDQAQTGNHGAAVEKIRCDR